MNLGLRFKEPRVQQRGKAMRIDRRRYRQYAYETSTAAFFPFSEDDDDDPALSMRDAASQYANKLQELLMRPAPSGERRIDVILHALGERYRDTFHETAVVERRARMSSVYTDTWTRAPHGDNEVYFIVECWFQWERPSLLPEPEVFAEQLALFHSWMLPHMEALLQEATVEITRDLLTDTIYADANGVITYLRKQIDEAAREACNYAARLDALNEEYRQAFAEQTARLWGGEIWELLAKAGHSPITLSYARQLVEEVQAAHALDIGFLPRPSPRLADRDAVRALVAAIPSEEL